MRPVLRADTLTTFMRRLSRNLGASTSWNPLGLSRAVQGLLYVALLTYSWLAISRRFLHANIHYSYVQCDIVLERSKERVQYCTYRALCKDSNYQTKLTRIFSVR